jgi:hypothetical protein
MLGPYELLPYFVFGSFALIVGVPVLLRVVRWLNEMWLDPPREAAPREPPEGTTRGEYFPAPPPDWQASKEPDASFRPADRPIWERPQQNDWPEDLDA